MVTGRTRNLRPARPKGRIGRLAQSLGKHAAESMLLIGTAWLFIAFACIDYYKKIYWFDVIDCPSNILSGVCVRLRGVCVRA